MARDPKNFTGENMAALLAAEDRRVQSVGDIFFSLKFYGGALLLFLVLAVFVYGVGSLLLQFARNLHF